MKGIDVSYWQGQINWDEVKQDNIDFAILRIGYSDTKDSTFERNYQEATRVGIPVGCYLYSYATSVKEAIEEANTVIQWLNGRKLQLPIYFDIEDKSQQNLGKETLNNMCISFCNTIEKAGYWAGIYSNKYWATSIISGEELGKKYTYWIAQYNDKCTYDGDYAIWQYSSDGNVAGITNVVDMNEMVKDIIQRDNKEPEPQLEKKSIDEIAKEVIDGKWGNGEDRKQRLTQAGYDYNVVQNKVNELLEAQQPITYIVQPGDTLSGIAQKYNTTYPELARKNNIADPNKIYVGQKIII